MALGALAFTLRPAESRSLTRVYAVMSSIVCAVVWLNVIRLASSWSRCEVSDERSHAHHGRASLHGLLVARAASGLVYLGVSLGRWPVPWYIPLERRWRSPPSRRASAMRWFGATAAAILAAAVFGPAHLGRERARAAGALRTLPSCRPPRGGRAVLLVDYAYSRMNADALDAAPSAGVSQGP